VAMKARCEPERRSRRRTPASRRRRRRSGHAQGAGHAGAEEHKLELERTEIVGRPGGLVARVEVRVRKPLDHLLAEAPEVAGDLEWLRQEDERCGRPSTRGPRQRLAGTSTAKRSSASSS